MLRLASCQYPHTLSARAARSSELGHEEQRQLLQLSAAGSYWLTGQGSQTLTKPHAGSHAHKETANANRAACKYTLFKAHTNTLYLREPTTSALWGASGGCEADGEGGVG